MTRPFPSLEPNKHNADFVDGLKHGVLRLQRCASDGHYQFPPAPVCAACLSRDLAWVDSGGRGILWSWIVLHRAYYPDVEPRLPYTIGLVQLDEGPRIMMQMSSIEGIDLVCDMPVEVHIVRDGNDDIPTFKPRNAERQ